MPQKGIEVGSSLGSNGRAGNLESLQTLGRPPLGVEERGLSEDGEQDDRKLLAHRVSASLSAGTAVLALALALIVVRSRAVPGGLRLLTLRTPIGRKAQPRFVFHSAPLVRVKLKDLAAAGVEQVPRTVGIEDGRPALEDGRVLDVSNVIWCTGFKEEFPWIDLPIFDENKRPLHERGVVVGEPGLYFVGLPFQYALSSDVLPGVGRDAEYIAKHIARNFTSRLSNDRALILEPTGA